MEGNYLKSIQCDFLDFFYILSLTVEVYLRWKWQISHFFVSGKMWKIVSVSNTCLPHCIYTLTGHFIRYTFLVPGWTHFCLLNCLNSSWHRFNKVLETFLRDFGPYWHDSITQLLQIYRLHIHDANLPVPTHPKAALLDWDLVTVEAIWVKWTHCHVQETSLRRFEICDMVHYPAGSSIRRWVHCSHKGMDMVSNNTQVGCGV